MTGVSGSVDPCAGRSGSHRSLVAAVAWPLFALTAVISLPACDDGESTTPQPCAGASCGAGGGGNAGGSGGHGAGGGRGGLGGQGGTVEPQVLAVGRDGGLATIARDDPWPVLATATLAQPSHGARFHSGHYFVVHPAPADRISIVAASDLSVDATIAFEPGADPRDIAFVDGGIAVVTQRGRPALAKLDLHTFQWTEVDLTPLADADGNPDAAMLASCGARVFVQLQRIDHTAQPGPVSDAPMLGVIDVSATADTIVDVDPATPGVQGIALAAPPDFDMQVDCDGGALYVAEPIPLTLGGGGYEQVQLDTFAATTFTIADLFGEVGGFRFTAPDTWWVIVHTEFGPAPSSHLNRFSSSTPAHSAWDTFAPTHIDNLAFDEPTGQLYFPDGCTTDCTSTDRAGVQVFDADSTERLTAQAIDVGFAPIEVVLTTER